MEKLDNTRRLWEFELLGFLREEFPNVGIAMPNLMNQPTLWRAVYLIMQGIHEIARFHDDLVDMRLDMDENLNLEFKFFALRGDLNDDYFNIINLVAKHDMDGLYDVVCRYCPPHLQTDHKANLDYIAEIVEQGQKLDLEGPQALAPKKEEGRPGSFVFKSDPKNLNTDQISFGKI